MTCISDHAETLLIYYQVESEWLEIDEEDFVELSDAKARAKELSKECEDFIEVYEVRVVKDGKRIYPIKYYIEHY